MAQRLPLIAGNWKMNLNHLEAIALVQKIAFALPEKYFAKVEVAVLPPFVDIRSIQTLVDGDKLLLKYGAQDLSPHDSGAYTGDISGPMLAKLGCSYVTVGHSERREYHAETDDLVNRKVKAALKHGITPILCLGERLEVREAGNHVQHCTDQLVAGLEVIVLGDLCVQSFGDLLAQPDVADGAAVLGHLLENCLADIGNRGLGHPVSPVPVALP